MWIVIDLISLSLLNYYNEIIISTITFKNSSNESIYFSKEKTVASKFNKTYKVIVTAGSGVPQRSQTCTKLPNFTRRSSPAIARPAPPYRLPSVCSIKLSENSLAQLRWHPIKVAKPPSAAIGAEIAHATRAGRLSLKLKLERLLCRALAARVCRDLLRLLAWPVMDFQLRADRVCRDASQMRPKCRLLPQFSFSFCFGLGFRCVACRPIGRVALAACGPQFVNN